MQIEKVKLSTLKLDTNNLRGHNEEEIQLLSRSLTVFGQYKPILVDKDNMTVKVGNGRLMAMRQLGWTECDCILLDWNDKRGLEVIDNRINELSSWVDKDLKKWFQNKGNEWWGIDDEIMPKVEKYIKQKEKPKNNEVDVKTESSKPVCPCCGKELMKKKRIILD